MKNRFSSFVIYCSLFIATIHNIDAVEINKIKKSMIDDLSSVRRTFESGYAPAEWKNEQFGWNLDVEFENAKEQILFHPHITNNDFKQILRSFVTKTRDYHVSILYFSTASSFLPFSIKTAEGRYFISDIEEISPETSSLYIGDEVLEFDGYPIEEVVALQQAKFGHRSNENTDRAIITDLLTHRLGLRGDDTPSGEIIIKTRSVLSGEVASQNFTWDHIPELISHPVDWLQSVFAFFKNESASQQKNSLGLSGMANPYYSSILNEKKHFRFAQAKVKSIIPETGRIIWSHRHWNLFSFSEDDTSSASNHHHHHDHHHHGHSCSSSEDSDWSSSSGSDDSSSFSSSSESSSGSESSSSSDYSSGSNPFWYQFGEEDPNFDESEDSAPTWLAIIYENELCQKIGYIRIPDYEAEHEELQELGKIITFFQKETDALIIDQTDNPGGNLFTLNTIASMLTDKPLATPMDRIMLTQATVYEAFESLQMLDMLDNLLMKKKNQTISKAQSMQLDKSIKMMKKDPSLLLNDELGFMDEPFQELTLEIAQVKKYFNFIVEQWNSGKPYTDPVHLLGIDSIQPHPKHRYTKPLLVLINELDFSCGDFFPALIQDNHTGVLFGSNTAGAGGAVTFATFVNSNGIRGVSYTYTLSERSTSEKIENIGVKPDIEYQLTVNDLQDDYVDFRHAIHETLIKMLPEADRNQIKPKAPVVLK